jgi:DNA-binding NarL/FixJ family response regulator
VALGKLKILVADDHELMLRELIIFLSCEFEVVAAVSNGLAVVVSAMAVNPDVIVSDICMPGLTGPEAMVELSARGLRIPFVFVSACSSFMEPSASFVAKSNIWEELLPAIRAAASGRAYHSRGACMLQNP